MPVRAGEELSDFSANLRAPILIANGRGHRVINVIITRRPGEKIMVGEDIVVHVMEIVGNSVRVGIEAPRSIPVYREEIWNAVRDENRAAADSVPDDLPQSARPGEAG